jgi:hypothetical protein
MLGIENAEGSTRNGVVEAWYFHDEGSMMRQPGPAGRRAGQLGREGRGTQ